MIEIMTKIEIKASPKKVWKILTDFDKYPEWNPFIKYLKGEVKENKKIEVKIIPLNSKGMVFKPKVLKYEENTELRWLGNTILPKLFDGEHIFQIIDNKDGTVIFIQKEEFRGILVPILKFFLDGNTKKGFIMMNEKIKELSEKNYN